MVYQVEPMMTANPSAADCDADGQLQDSGSVFSRNRTEPVDSPAVVRSGSLRQRGGVAAPVEIEESLLQPGQAAPLRRDSLNLFATLVPPPLRKSKKNFTSVVDYAVEASNLAHRILVLREIVETGAGNGGQSQMVTPSPK
eukprot:jgi/Undpi1/11866/HiC_scaffold_4.g01565.m1